MTSRLPGRTQLVFRVESAEAATALASAFGPRDPNGVAAGADVAVEQAASSSGQALPGDLRDRFEGSLGTDLSSVRLHTGGESAQAAGAVGAKAYTVGQDIHFGAGHYDPSSAFGVHLIAHEVAHTVQQQGAAPTRQNKLEVSTPGDSAEVEADRAADAMVQGTPAAVSSSGIGAARVVMREFNETSDASVPDTSVTDTKADVPAGPAVPAGGATVPPPAALDWGATAAVASTPSAAWGGAPSYKDAYSSPGNLETYRAAFSSSWSAAQTSFNNIHKMHDTIRGTEKQVAPILKISDNATVGAQVANVNATDAFQGDKLAPGSSKMESTKNTETREAIVKTQEALVTANLDVDNKQLAVGTTQNDAAIAVKSLDQMSNALQITMNDSAIEKLGLDKEQVQRDLDAYKANVAAAVGAVKAVSSIVKAVGLPTWDNITGAIDQTADAGGAIAEAALVAGANNQLAAIDQAMGRLIATKASLSATNAATEVQKARLSVDTAKKNIQKALNDLKAARIARDAKYRELATLVAKAGLEGKMSKKDAALLGAAIEAIPKIKQIITYCGVMKGGMPTPAYSEASGIGAAMATNAGAFTSGIGVIKGTADYVTEIKSTWEARLASVEATIAASTSVKSDW